MTCTDGLTMHFALHWRVSSIVHETPFDTPHHPSAGIAWSDVLDCLVYQRTHEPGKSFLAHKGRDSFAITHTFSHVSDVTIDDRDSTLFRSSVNFNANFSLNHRLPVPAYYDTMVHTYYDTMVHTVYVLDLVKRNN